MYSKTMCARHVRRLSRSEDFLSLIEVAMAEHEGGQPPDIWPTLDECSEVWQL